MFETPPSAKKAEEEPRSRRVRHDASPVQGEPAVGPIGASASLYEPKGPNSEAGEDLAAAVEADLAQRPAAGAKDPTEAIDFGLPIDEFARKFGQSEAEVWRRLRRGELIGRTQRGRLFVFQTEPASWEAVATRVDGASGRQGRHHIELPVELPVELPQPAAPANLSPELEKELADLPPLPPGEAITPVSRTRAGAYLAFTGEQAAAPEIALLIDHLSLAKEENREILRLTQDSIRRVTELTDRIVDMKDQLLAAKDSEVEALRRALDTEKNRSRRLAQQNEDLEMLARVATKAAAENGH